MSVTPASLSLSSRLTRFLLLQAGVLLLGTVLVGIGGGLFFKSTLHSMWQARFKTEARSLCAVLSDVVRDQASLLESVSYDPLLRVFDKTIDSGTQEKLLRLHRRSFSKLEFFPAENVASTDSLLQKARQMPGQVVVGDLPFKQRLNSKKVRFLICQVSEKGVALGCLQGIFRLNLRKQILRQNLLGSFRVDLFNHEKNKSSVQIFPYQSQYLKEWVSKELVKIVKGKTQEPFQVNDDVFFYESRITDTPWTAAVTAPIEAFQQETQDIERIFWLILIPAMLLMFLFNFQYLRKKVLIPAAEIENYTTKISAEFSDEDASVKTLGPDLGFLRSYFQKLHQQVLQFKESEQNYQNTLQAEVHAMTKDLQERTKSLEEMNRRREEAQTQLIHAEKMAVTSRLIAGVAHEIRNPLASMALAVDNLLAMGKGKRTPSEEKYLKILRGDITRLSDLLTHVLELSRPSKDRFQAASLNEIIEDVLRMLEWECTEKGVEIERCLDSSVSQIDLLREDLKNCFLNLLRNSLEAVGDKGSVRIVSREEQDCIKVLVMDSGPGISELQRTKIFDMFYTTKEKGTGLGLTQVMQAVKMHGGNVKILEGELKGACFELSFPKK